VAAPVGKAEGGPLERAWTQDLRFDSIGPHACSVARVPSTRPGCRCGAGDEPTPPAQHIRLTRTTSVFMRTWRGPAKRANRASVSMTDRTEPQLALMSNSRARCSRPLPASSRRYHAAAATLACGARELRLDSEGRGVERSGPLPAERLPASTLQSSTPPWVKRMNPPPVKRRPKLGFRRTPPLAASPSMRR
jgi:hypothetical protein